jgi:hypothetical protein
MFVQMSSDGPADAFYTFYTIVPSCYVLVEFCKTLSSDLREDLRDTFMRIVIAEFPNCPTQD